VRQNKTPQHENRNFSEMREYFCTKFYTNQMFHAIFTWLRENDGNLKLKNKFCNWTNVDFSFQLGCDVSVTSKPSDLHDF